MRYGKCQICGRRGAIRSCSSRVLGNVKACSKCAFPSDAAVAAVPQMRMAEEGADRSLVLIGPDLGGARPESQSQLRQEGRDHQPVPKVAGQVRRIRKLVLGE